MRVGLRSVRLLLVHDLFTYNLNLNSIYENVNCIE